MKILFTPITGSSIAHTVRSLAIADELKNKGHEIYFTSCNVRKDFIEKNGYKVIETYETVNLNDNNDQSANYLSNNRKKFINWFSAEIKATKKILPDVVVSAAAILGPHTYYATGTPIISVMDSQYLDESRGLMGMSLSEDSLIHKIETSILRPIFNKEFTKVYLREVLEIYKELGLRTNFNSRKELYDPMAVIIPSDPIFEPLRIKRKETIYVGPLFWDGFEKMDTDLTEDKILDFKKNSKLVYVSFGASVFDKRIYDVVLDNLIKTKHKVIVGLGPNWKREEFISDNENLIIRTIVPGMRLSRYADIIINTGSQGAVMQGLTYGTPQVAFPTTMDQSYFANRMEELKVGINVNKISILDFSKRESFSKFPNEIGNKIVRSIEKIESNINYKKNAIEYSNNIIAFKNPPLLAAEFITNYVNKNI